MKGNKPIILSILFFLLLIFSDAFGKKNPDSLLLKLEFEQPDSTRLELLIELSKYYNKDSRYLEKCEEILEQALLIAAKESNQTALSRVYHSYGVLYRNIAEYNKALGHHNKSLQHAQEANNIPLIASAYNSIGVVYRRMDNHPRATQYHLLGLKAAETAKDTFNIAVSLNSLGNIYSLNGQYNEAFSYFKRALDLARIMNNTLGQAINYNNIGEVYEFMGVMDSAYVYYNKSLKANKSIESQKGIAISYNAIGKILLHYGKVKEAYNLFNQALRIDKKLGDKKFITDTYINISRALIELNKLDEAEECANKGIEIAKEIGSIIHTQWAYENLSRIYSKRSKPDTAFYFYRRASVFKDSLLNEKNARAIAMMEVMFETEKKEGEIQLLKQTKKINEKELARQKVIRNFYLFGFVFAIILLFSVIYALNIKRKANKVLATQKAEIEKSHSQLSIQQKEIISQKEEIEKQRNNIEQKNSHLENAYRVIEGYISKITDSIRYAERIQTAILPPLSMAKEHFSDSFYLYKPKDFVSGDFYWLTNKNGKLIIAAADCTGHGVPGAFMSIIGMDLLSQAVNQQNITEPAQILDFLNLELRNKLRKEEEEELILKDSMDIAILTINANDKSIQYSGALIPITIIRNGEIIGNKPDFRSIGTSAKLFNRPFTQKTIDIEKGDWIYLYTDGFMDQFGGDDKKKYNRRRFYKTLTSIYKYSGKKQKNELNRIFSEWKGNNEQIDDVLVLGLKV
ncbi:MAG: tetratricopeptide repeat protein [Bacteroidales bacterium]